MQVIGNGKAGTLSGKTAYGSRGQYKLLVQNVGLGTAAPTARLTMSPSVVTTETLVTFDASTSSDEKPGLTHSWALGEGTRRSGPDAKAQTIYKTPGTYSIFVQVRDSDGFTSVARTTIKVMPLGTASARSLAAPL